MTSRWLRLGALVLVFALLFLAAHLSGLREGMTAERLQGAVLEAGWWGVLLFFFTFAVGQVLQVPGVVFILVARAAWGPLLGFANAYVGSLLAATLVFMLVRAVGGKPLAEVTWPPARRILAGLERRPVLTVATLRVVMMLAPPLNYALALSGVRQRHHLAGSAAGLLVSVSVVVFLSEGAIALVRSFI